MQTPLIFDDINGLKEEWCKTVLARNRIRKVQGGSLFMADFSCKDVSLYNTKRGKNKSFIAQGSDSTGRTSAGACGHIWAHGPVMTLLENVRGLRG